MVDDEDWLIYMDYMATYPDSLTRYYIDEDNEVLMSRLIKLMDKALDAGEPLDDSVLNIPDDADV